jgi:hypothetical protein
LYFNQGKIYHNILGKNYPRIDVYSVFRNKFFSDVLAENSAKTDAELKEKSLEEYAISKMIGASTGLLNTALCIDIESLGSSYGMLPEERKWLLRNEIKLVLQLRPDAVDEVKRKEVLDKAIDPDHKPSKKDLQEMEKYLRIEEDFDGDNFD